MKNNLLKYYIVAVYFTCSFAMFAQPGDKSEFGTQDLEGEDPKEGGAPVPINSYIPILMLAGLSLAFIKISNKSEIK